MFRLNFFFFLFFLKECFFRLRYTTPDPKAGENDLKGMDSQIIKDRKYSRAPGAGKAGGLGIQRTTERVWGHHTWETEGMGRVKDSW